MELLETIEEATEDIKDETLERPSGASQQTWYTCTSQRYSLFRKPSYEKEKN